MFFASEKARHFQPEIEIFPIPDLVVEVVSEETEERDRGIKFQDYETHGVEEYWIVDADAGVIEQYIRGGDGRYELRIKSSSGELVSPVLGGAIIGIKGLFGKA